MAQPIKQINNQMVIINLYITQDQRKYLVKKSLETKLPMSDIIREAINRYMVLEPLDDNCTRSG